MVARLFFPKWTFVILLQSVSGWQKGSWRIKEIFWNWVIERFYRLAACDLRKIWKQRMQWTLGNNWCTGESVQTNVYRRLFTVEKCTNGKCTKIAQRRDLWGIAWQMISQRPLRGKGGQQKKRREWLWRRKPPPPLLKESKRWRLHFQLASHRFSERGKLASIDRIKRWMLLINANKVKAQLRDKDWGTNWKMEATIRAS